MYEFRITSKTIVFLLFQISQRKARRTEIIMAMREDRNVFTLHAKKIQRMKGCERF
jgi:hypothetical protein